MKKILLLIGVLLTFIGCSRDVRKDTTLGKREYISKYVTEDTFAVQETLDATFLKEKLYEYSSEHLTPENATVFKEQLDLLNGSIYTLISKNILNGNLGSNPILTLNNSFVFVANVDLKSAKGVISKNSQDFVKEGNYFKYVGKDGFLPKYYYYIDRKNNFVFASKHKENLDKILGSKTKNDHIVTMLTTNKDTNKNKYNLGSVYLDKDILDSMTEAVSGDNSIIKQDVLDNYDKNFLGFIVSGAVSDTKALTLNIKEKVNPNTIAFDVRNKKVSSKVNKENSFYLSFDSSIFNENFDYRDDTNELKELFFRTILNLDNDLYFDFSKDKIVITQKDSQKAKSIVDDFNKFSVANTPSTKTAPVASLTSDSNGNSLITITTNMFSNVVDPTLISKKSINPNDTLYFDIQGDFLVDKANINLGLPSNFAITALSTVESDGVNTNIVFTNYEGLLRAIFSVSGVY